MSAPLVPLLSPRRDNPTDEGEQGCTSRAGGSQQDDEAEKFSSGSVPATGFLVRAGMWAWPEPQVRELSCSAVRRVSGVVCPESPTGTVWEFSMTQFTISSYSLHRAEVNIFVRSNKTL